MDVVEISDDNIAEILKENSKVLIDCYAPWCGPCRMLAPIIEQLASEHSDVKFCKINIDENDKVCLEYQIMSIPTILFFENGKLKKQTVGFQAKEELVELIKS